MAKLRPVCPPNVGKNRVGTLTLDNLGHHFPSQWLNVGAIGRAGVGHDGSGDCYSPRRFHTPPREALCKPGFRNNQIHMPGQWTMGPEPISRIFLISVLRGTWLPVPKGLKNKISRAYHAVGNFF